MLTRQQVRVVNGSLDLWRILPSDISRYRLYL
jgi:hypothetical protein